MISAAHLRELLDYNPKTGLFKNRVNRNRLARRGEIAGSKNGKGYWQIHIDGKNYSAHRLAWLYVTGVWPKGEVDHINLVRTDNRWQNLREATRSQNRANSKALNTNTSGKKGVTWHATGGKWQAQIMVDGKCIYLGLFKTPEFAHAAYCKAAKTYFGKFARAA